MQTVISNALETWTSFYANHATVRTAVVFLHVGGLVIGGGCAIAADRMTLMARNADDLHRTAQVRALRGTHRIVMAGLGIVIASGLLLLAADTDTLLHSAVFWIKMGLFVMLLGNGLFLTRAEKHAERGSARGWKQLTRTSAASIVLWMLTTLAGAALLNAG